VRGGQSRYVEVSDTRSTRRQRLNLGVCSGAPAEATVNPREKLRRQMIYLIAAFAILFVAVLCFVLDGLLARVMFRVFWAFDISRDRAGFIRGYRLFIRSVGIAMIIIIVAGLALR
jgi:hypothetical protein